MAGKGTFSDRINTSEVIAEIAAQSKVEEYRNSCG
jgi:hypothetical protein